MKKLFIISFCIIVFILIGTIASYVIPTITSVVNHVSEIKKNSKSSINLLQFYRLKVSLTHKPNSLPVEIDMIIGCGSKTRQVLGESASSISIRVPNIYGIQLESGEGVLVQTPDVCGEDPKEIIPDDFMPLMFYAPDADDLEFMIAHVSTISYDQKFSQLLFHKATVEKATKEDFEKWKNRGVPNIIDTRLTSNGFYEGIFSQYYPPENDIRYGEAQIGCYSKIRVPIPERMKKEIRALWPDEKPKIWVPARDNDNGWISFNTLVQKAFKERGSDQETISLLGRDNDRDYTGHTASSGIYNPQGNGGIDIDQYRSPNSSLYFGEALRIPYRTNTGYPWISAEIKSKKYQRRSQALKLSISGRPPADEVYVSPPDSYEYYLDTKLGADKGFAYCYRDVGSRFRDLKLAYSHDSRKQRQSYWSHSRKIFIDEKLEVFSQTIVPKHWIEEDKYFLKDSYLSLHSLEARQDARY